MRERLFRARPVFEWVAAALIVFVLIWLISVPVQRLMGPRVEAAIGEVSSDLPAGVPSKAINIPVLLLLDGREIRLGELRSRVDLILPEKLADGPPHISTGEFGDRHTRAYLVNGTRFYVVCERRETGGPMRVAGIYLP